MKKAPLIITMIAILIALIALPVAADDACNTDLDYIALARQQVREADFANAFASVDCERQLNGETYRYYMTLALIHCNTDGIEQAIENFTRAIELEPNNPYGYNNRGWANFRLGNYDEALRNLNIAIELDPDLAYAYNNRGLVYHMQGEHDLALADFETAIDLGLPQAWASINLYNLEFEIGKLDVDES